MESLSRQEYPAMLERLQPAGAVAKLNERVRKIGKVNTEIADWLQERRKVEDAYIAGLRKLARKPLTEVGELGVFTSPWKNIVSSVEEIANSHMLLSERIEKDVETPLRNFTSNNREMSAMTTIQGNLAAMAKELEAAQEKNERLGKKGGKNKNEKLDAAATQLQNANQQWDSQAPYIFETLQALDERRLNHLRDVLTQYETHEADQLERNRKTVEETLSSLLEVDTAQEIKNWSDSAVAGKPITERRARQLSTPGSTAGSGSIATTHVPAPPTPRSTHTDNQSEHSGGHEKESKLKSRFGTMLGRRRQSIHGAFGRTPSPNKGFQPFGRNSASRDGRPAPSPRASSNNLRESPPRDTRLSSLAESPPLPLSPVSQTNGTASAITPDTSFISDVVPARHSATATNGTSAASPDLSDVQPPPGPPPSHMKPLPEMRTDSEGFTVPAARNDPISQAESDAAAENEQPQFKLDIRNEPIPEQDADAQAALSNVANTLRSSQLATPNRKAGTVRGRRDVRNTVYMPTGNSLDVISDSAVPPSPGVAVGRAAALAALSSSEHPVPAGSDTTSIRSGHSLTNHALAKHADMHQPGLNASIIETVNASFENGEIKTFKISGEVALIYNKTLAEDAFETADSETIRINNFPNLEAIGPNRTFIHPISEEKPDEFTIDLATVSSKPSVAFTYRVHVDETAIPMQGPLLLKVAWKPQGDKLALVLEYSLNPACSTQPVTFNNLVLVAVYQGPRATGCQTKPTGTHIKDKSLVYWRLGDVTLTQEWHKVICRFVGAEGACPEPGHIEARWEVPGSPSLSIGSGISLSKLIDIKGKEKEEVDDNPFADDSVAPPSPGVNWVDIETSTKFVSGKYEARAV